MSKREQVDFLREFYRGKRVLVSGVHGFKGAWLAVLLHELGAEVFGVGLQAPDGLLFPLLRLEELGVRTQEVDVREREFSLLIEDFNPEVAFHLAAQPIVSVGFSDPYLTYSTNVLGVVNFLEGLRALPGKVSAVNVSSDKVYQNIEKPEPYLEGETLMGEDPYSSSKSCSELVTYAYRSSYFQKTVGTPSEKLVSTCRAGNVIGGGDFALNRIIPDMVRALSTDSPVTIRNFGGVRPYEHVLDALYAYVLLAARQWEDPAVVGAYNVGPNDEVVLTTRHLVDFFQERTPLQVVDGSAGITFPEATLLKLDSNKFRKTFQWAPTWGTPEEMLGATLAWYQNYLEGGPVTEFTLQQVRSFLHA